MFEKATRLKLRFNFRGLCSTEDLWDLPLKSLDLIYKELNATLKTQKEESLLDTKSKEDELLDLAISIIKHIVEVRLLEQKEKRDEKQKKVLKQKLLEIKDRKEDEKYNDMPVEEIDKLIKDL